MAALLTPVEVAERWGCHPRTVRRLAEHGDLRGLRVGDLWRFRPEDVTAYELDHTNGSAPAPTAERQAPPTSATARPAEFDLPPDYEPVFPELWGRETDRAASSAAPAKRAARQQKAASVRGRS